MIAVEREKWRVRLPSRCEEVVVEVMVVFAVLNVVRAEAWEKRREEDSVAVLIWRRGVLLICSQQAPRQERGFLRQIEGS
jgi:hypothetical protein